MYGQTPKGFFDVKIKISCPFFSENTSVEKINSKTIGSYSLCGTVDSCFWWVSKLSMEMTGWPWALVITLANIGCDLSRLEALAVCTWTCIPVFNDWVTTANNKHNSYKLIQWCQCDIHWDTKNYNNAECSAVAYAVNLKRDRKLHAYLSKVNFYPVHLGKFGSKCDI